MRPTSSRSTRFLSTHLAYDRLTDRNAVTGLGEIRLRMLMLLPVIASLEDRLAALGEEALRRQPELKRLLEDLAQWIASDVGARQPAERIRAMIAERQAVLDDSASWERIITTSLLSRLRELVDLSRDCRVLTEAIAESRNVSTLDLAFHSEAGAAPVRHRDRGLALWSAAGAAVAILICCAFWIGDRLARRRLGADDGGGRPAPSSPRRTIPRAASAAFGRGRWSRSWSLRSTCSRWCPRSPISRS